MEKLAMIEQHFKNHQLFIEQIEKMTTDQYLQKPGGKWCADEQIQHVTLTLDAVIKGFSIPKQLLSLQFGVANRPSKDYDALVEKYLSKLANAGAFELPKSFTPAEAKSTNQEKFLKKLESQVAKYAKLIEKKKDADLDKYILPHPLLGKVTLREMVYFTNYHVLHHQKQLVTV